MLLERADDVAVVFTEEPVFSPGRAAEDRTVTDGPVLLWLCDEECEALLVKVESEKREVGCFCGFEVLWLVPGPVSALGSGAVRGSRRYLDAWWWWID